MRFRKHTGESYETAHAKVNIVGPTPTIYQEFISDRLRLEYGAETKYGKDSELHNMASIVTLFRRFPSTDPDGSGHPLLSMLYTGDAHDRECKIRDTVISFAGPMPPRHVDVLRIPHHGSISSTSVGFYHRITATVYLVCARQSLHGLPNLGILEAIVDQTMRRDDGLKVHIFFSNPDSLWNIRRPKSPNENVNTDMLGKPSNLKLLLSGEKRPGAVTRMRKKYNYTCYVLGEPAWWDIWDENRDVRLVKDFDSVRNDD